MSAKERSSTGSMYMYCTWLVTGSYNYLTVHTGTDLVNFYAQLGLKNPPEREACRIRMVFIASLGYCSPFNHVHSLGSQARTFDQKRAFSGRYWLYLQRWSALATCTYPIDSAGPTERKLRCRVSKNYLLSKSIKGVSSPALTPAFFYWRYQSGREQNMKNAS
jgi:hypothetical protein